MWYCKPKQRTSIVLLALQIGYVVCFFKNENDIYKPGAGLLRMTIEHNITTHYSNAQLCPKKAENLDNFSWHHRSALNEPFTFVFKAYFVSNQTGNHQFFATCNDRCDLSFNLDRSMIKHQGSGHAQWIDITTSKTFYLYEGCRYLLSGTHNGEGLATDFFGLGVTLPDKTEVKPINSRFLRRSMEFYYWHGFLVKRYDSISLSSPYNSTDFEKDNAAIYPHQPTETLPCATNLDVPNDDLYALKYSGFFYTMPLYNYKFEMECDDLCRMKLYNHQMEANKGTATLGPVTFQHQEVPIEILFVESAAPNYLKVKNIFQNASYEMPVLTSNLLYHATHSSIVIKAIALSSTELSVELKNPHVPDRDLWEHSSKFDVFYCFWSYQNCTKLTRTGDLPLTITISGLAKFKFYQVKAHFFGKMNKTLDYNLISSYTLSRTQEDVPEIYPPNLVATALSSSSIQCSWTSVLNKKLLHGYLNKYILRYISEYDETENWTLRTIGTQTQWTVTNLNKFTQYNFSLAAGNSKYNGPFSPVITERTMEDVPIGAPSNVAARNASESSVLVQWEDIPIRQRHGLITNYMVYIRRWNASESWVKVNVNGLVKSSVISGLKSWTFYDVAISGKTVVGEGPKSDSFTVRTDEDKPTGAPNNLNATALSSVSIQLSWGAIDHDLTNGLIISYEIAYQRADKKESEKREIARDKTLTVSGLDEYVVYEFRIAGTTRKGVGIFSPVVSERSLEDVPAAPPALFSGRNLSSTAIQLSWDVIAEDDRNGIITSYTVRHRLNGASDEWQNTVLDSANFSVIIRQLEIFTWYEFQIAGSTVVGQGPNSTIIVIQTDSEGPGAAPFNLTGHFINHSAINVTWSCVAKKFWYGSILSYILRYKDSTLPDSSWTNITVPKKLEDNCANHYNISGLKIYTPYVFLVSAVNQKADGVISNKSIVWTDEFVPEEWPRNLSGHNFSSTGIALSWRAVPEIHGAANGKVLGYRISYHVIYCYSDRPTGCDENEVFEIETPDARLNFNLTNLRKYTNYSISIQVFNSKGSSNLTDAIYVKTAEDEPDAPPSIVETWPGTFNSIRVFWNPIPESKRNGRVLAYRIFYSLINVPIRRYDRAPRSVNSLAVLGALPGEKVIDVANSVNELELKSLEYYSWYRVRVAALTSKGLGDILSINGTCKQDTPIEAPKLQVIDSYSLHEITIKWNQISFQSARGTLLGFRITHWPIEVNGDPVIGLTEVYADILAPKKNLTLKNLRSFTKYAITISGFTEAGFGVVSETAYGETCRCAKAFKASWISAPPLVKGGKHIQGIFPKFIQGAVMSCCASCGDRQEPTTVDWLDESTNKSSQKYDQMSLRESLVSGRHIALPAFRDRDEVEGNEDTVFSYVPILSSPGIALFRRKPTVIYTSNEVAKDLTNSIVELLPFFSLMVLLTTVAGIVFWFLERSVNVDEFSNSFLRGSGSGFWLAFVTMTTAGYGDISPKTILGRIFAVAWTFCGLVITSLLVGAIATFQTSISLGQDTVVQKGPEKTLASNETFMMSIKNLKQRTVIGNTSDLSFVRQALLSGNVTRVVYEAIDAENHKPLLSDPMMELEAFKQVDASYGVLLAGEAKRMKTCFRGYFTENSQQIVQEMSSYSFPFKVAKLSNNLEVPEVFSSDADITKDIAKYGLLVLLVSIVFGAMFDFIRWIRRRAKITSAPSEIEQLFDELSVSIEKLVKVSRESADDLETAHAYERLRLFNADKKDIRAIDRNLVIFDETVRERYGEQKRTEQPNQKYAVNDDSDDSIGDGEIYYRATDLHAR